MVETGLDRAAARAGSTQRKKAYIVDDDEAFRRSTLLLLKTHGWEAEGFGSPQAFIARAGELEPGLLLLDLNMPGKSGLELLESGIPEMERFAVIMVTGAGQIQTAVRSIKAGALDFIEKPFGTDELFGRLESLNETLWGTLDAKGKVDSLSPRERDVLERLLSGASNKMVARALDLSPRTVEMHRARMIQKLSVETTAEALELARRAGLKAIEHR